MAWGGSLNNEGTKYLRIIRSADRTIEYLEELKQFLTEQEKDSINKTIDIITDHINRLTRGKIEDL
ncbi:MAG: hypothetical protein ACTSPD_04735 [Promethearchaeota archaeon]